MRFSTLFAAAALATAVGSASAVPVYGSLASPGVYFGTGNAGTNFNWWVNTDNNIEVGLRAKNRATLGILDGSSGTYTSAGGLCNPVCSGGAKAMWNYELSVNVRADGSGSADLDDFFVRLFVDTDSSAASNFVALDILNQWPDAYFWDGSAPRRAGTTPLSGEYGVQQSANPLFGDSGFGFLPGAGLYDLRLVVYANDGGQLGRELSATQISVAVLPEPTSLALVALALAAAGVSRRRRA